jgi:hypothetical protein
VGFYWFMLGILAVWRFTHLMQAENGPWNLLDRLRGLSAAGFWGSLFGCFYCLSLWVAVPFALLFSESWRERLLLWPALSAGAILLERLSSALAAAPPAAYVEEEEKRDVLLRKDGDKPAADVAFGGPWAGRRN